MADYSDAYRGDPAWSGPRPVHCGDRRPHSHHTYHLAYIGRRTCTGQMEPLIEKVNGKHRG